MESTIESTPGRFSIPPGDPLFHLISSNNPPTLEDLDLATERINEVNEELGSLHCKIKELEKRLVPLHAREEFLIQKRQQHSESMQKAVRLDSLVASTTKKTSPEIPQSPPTSGSKDTAAKHEKPEPNVISSNDQAQVPPIKLEDRDPSAIRSVEELVLCLGAVRDRMAALESQLALFKERERLLIERKLELPLHPESEFPADGQSSLPPPAKSPATTGDAQNSPALEALQAMIGEMFTLDMELRPIQDEIKVLVSQLAPLQLREEALLRRKREHSPILSPWRRLPSEILSEILQEAVNPVSPSFLSDSNTSTDRYHFKNLRSVCRLWREVAFGTYSLWTSMWVDFDKYRDDEQLDVIKSIGHYFQHAGPTLRLNVGFKWRREVEQGSPSIGDEGYAFDGWMDYLFSQRTRWEEITFFSEAYHFQLFEVRLRKDLELGVGGWKTLFLQVATHTNSLANTPTVPSVPDGTNVLYECFPTLETINLSSEDDILPTEGPLILLEGHPNLRKLRLDIYSDMNPYFSKLGGLRNLKKLLLNCPKLHITAPHDGCPIYEFPCLELLVVSCMPSFTFLTKLRTPALSTLQILTNIPPSSSNSTTSALQRALWTTFNELITFVQQCGQNLREFHLNCWFLRGDDSLRRLLEVLSPIERLCIDTWFMNRGTFDDKLQNSMYLPALQKFCVHAIDSRTVTFLQRVQLRRPVVTPEAPSGDDDEEAAEPVEGDEQEAAPASLPIPSPPPPSVPEVTGAGASQNAAGGNTDGGNGDGGNEDGGDDNIPFARGHFSWPSLGGYLESTKSRRNELIRRSAGGSGSGRKDTRSKFVVCIPDDACDAAGREAKAIVQSLEGGGLNVEHTATCKIFW